MSAKKESYPKSKIKILLLENIHDVAVEMLREEGFMVTTEKKALSEKELIAKAGDVHVLGVRSKTQITENFVKSADRLMTVGCFCIGTNQVHLPAARKKGIAVFNAPFSNTRSVAEMVMAEIVILARKLGDKNTKLHRGEWDKSAQGCYEVRGKTLGIIGYGHIGSQVSVLAESFGMRVVYFDILTKMPIGNSRQLKTLSELFRCADFVTLHVPETPQTKNMIGSAELKMFKKGSFLINASRGSVIDIPALVQALKSKQLEGAALDVFPEEPEAAGDAFNSDLQNMPNVILTPHVGGSTEEAQYNIGVDVATRLIRFINNGSSIGSVNFPQVDIPILQRAHRILNIHRNVPGVLKEITSIISDLGANIEGQYLATDPEIGYLIVDLDKSLSEKVKDKIKNLPTSIRTRILY